ncbi:MAG: ABC transporter permease [Bacilli bacterium]|nr:ABC transporter permease [Bacilli bacterium]
MIVFNAFFKVVKKYIGVIILYTVMLISFGSINYATNNENMTFSNRLPDILIINNDEEVGLTKNLINYLKENANVLDIENDEEKINDAIFYREVNYVIYIPKNYRVDTLNKLNPTIDIKSANDYDSAYTSMLLTRYLNVQNTYLKYTNNENELINSINNNLSYKTNIEITSKLDTSKLTKISRFFNFASYSIMAVIIYIICLVISSFNKDVVKKRTIISSMNYKKYNKYILLSSFIYSSIIWILYVILSFIIIGSSMFSLRGLIYILNTFIFSFVALTLALLISNLIKSKGAISGIVNVIALGQAFLCGAFIPSEFLGENIIKYSKILPAYWYNNSNDLLSTIEVINIVNLKPILLNMIVLVIFAVIFIVINNIVSKHRQIIG